MKYGPKVLIPEKVLSQGSFTWNSTEFYTDMLIEGGIVAVEQLLDVIQHGVLDSMQVWTVLPEKQDQRLLRKILTGIDIIL